MRIPIEKHVFELLKYNDCVIITGFGGFILHHRNAYLNKITQTINIDLALKMYHSPEG